MKYSKDKMRAMKNEEANIESALAALERRLEQAVANKDALEEQIGARKMNWKISYSTRQKEP